MITGEPVPPWRRDGPADGPLTVVLAHGAGQPMDSPFMGFFAAGVASLGYPVVRFEFPFMAARRQDGRPRPPDRTEVLVASWREVITRLGPAPLVIGGKSLGGRIASLVADEAHVCGLVCLGFPFHPPGRPDRLRTQHLMALKTPTLILQGSRDPFGSEAEVCRYPLSDRIEVRWIDGGDHDLRPPRRSGQGWDHSWTAALQAIAVFLAEREPRV